MIALLLFVGHLVKRPGGGFLAITFFAILTYVMSVVVCDQLFNLIVLNQFVPFIQKGASFSILLSAAS